jgi:hypothetical protein
MCAIAEKQSIRRTIDMVELARDYFVHNLDIENL